MLAREQRRRHHHRDLLARHHRDERRAQRHFGLAEADIAADQPVHRAAARQIRRHRLDTGQLVIRFLIGEEGDEFVISALGLLQRRRLLQLAFGGDLDQAVGDIANALLEPRLARLPRRAAETVEIGVGIVGTVAGQQFDILDRQEQLVAALILDFKAIMRGTRRRDRLKPEKPSDAVIRMDDQIAGAERGRLAEHVAALARLTAAHQAVAENILLADDGEIGRLEAALRGQARRSPLRRG